MTDCMKCGLYDDLREKCFYGHEVKWGDDIHCYSYRPRSKSKSKFVCKPCVHFLYDKCQIHGTTKSPDAISCSDFKQKNTEMYDCMKCISWDESGRCKMYSSPVTDHMYCASYVRRSGFDDIGQKKDAGKTLWGLLDWPSIEQIVKVLEFGASKYGRENWKKVPEMTRRYSEAAMRHLTAYMSGEVNDHETDLSHAAHVACNMMFLLWHERSNEMLDKEGGKYGTL